MSCIGCLLFLLLRIDCCSLFDLRCSSRVVPCLLYACVVSCLRFGVCLLFIVFVARRLLFVVRSSLSDVGRRLLLMLCVVCGLLFVALCVACLMIVNVCCLMFVVFCSYAVVWCLAFSCLLAVVCLFVVCPASCVVCCYLLC